MAQNYKPSIIPSSSDYVLGLTAIQPRISELQLQLLQEQYCAPNRTITASTLSALLNIEGGHGTINLMYGRLGRLFCEATGFKPSKRENGTYRWWSVWSSGYEEDESHQFFWEMHLEVAEALEILGWVSSNHSLQRSFLLCWNPQRFEWNNISEMSQSVQSGKLVKITWSCGNSKHLQKNDRVFFIRLGQKPKGIFASGKIIQGSYKAPHWEKEKAEQGQTSMFVQIQFDILLNPEKEKILPRNLLNRELFSKMHWDIQKSGVQIPDNIALELEKEWGKITNLQIFISPEEVLEDNSYYEGKTHTIKVNSYERNLKARSKCIEYYGAICWGCGFDFGKVFGELGEGFIHVHHLIPLSEIKAEYEIDPIQDLRPICPNCHAMIHRRSPPFSIEEIQSFFSHHFI